MNRHHPNTVARAVHLALDFQVVGFHPQQKPGQAGHIAGFIGKRLAEQGIDAVLCLGPQARQQLAAPVMPGQDPVDQVIRAQEIRLAQQIVNHDERIGEFITTIAQLFP